MVNELTLSFPEKAIYLKEVDAKYSRRCLGQQKNMVWASRIWSYS